jgi:lipopolysaccharide biosynthesis protein
MTISNSDAFSCSEVDLEHEPSQPKLIAFYLTQYHPIPENDDWWGKGFTEWTNVTKATPLFDGHYQPRLPADMGFYDLRVCETRREQISLAKKYGIDGFCYHYYWFSGKRLLEQPLEDMLSDSESDMPFCLCWANENWTRRWDAAEHEVLIRQHYLPEDDLGFIRSLMPYLSDGRYILADEKPLLIVYRPQHLPDPQKTLEIWRDYCHEQGLGEIHVAAALTHGNLDYAQFGFDSGVEFPPHNLMCKNHADSIQFTKPFRGFIGEYQEIANLYLQREYPHQDIYRGVFPAWDNTPRTGDRGMIVLGSSPENYRKWLSQAIHLTRQDFPAKERFVFINAWNEWAEGCYLEPDRAHGKRYLEATLAAKRGILLNKSSNMEKKPRKGDKPARTLVGDVREILHYHSFLWLGQIASHLKKYPRLRKTIRWVLGLFAK